MKKDEPHYLRGKIMHSFTNEEVLAKVQLRIYAEQHLVDTLPVNSEAWIKASELVSALTEYLQSRAK